MYIICVCVVGNFMIGERIKNKTEKKHEKLRQEKKGNYSLLMIKLEITQTHTFQNVTHEAF